MLRNFLYNRNVCSSKPL